MPNQFFNGPAPQQAEFETVKSNLGSPSSASSVTGADAFSKINTLNGEIVRVTTTTITAASGSWSSGTPKTQTISVTGVTASNLVTVSPYSSITATQLDALAEAKIICTAQASGSITLTCYGTTPSVNIPLMVTIMG